MYVYSWYQWLLFFFIYCFIGWCFESTVVSYNQKKFVNRGFLRIPLLPIYGFGACLILFATLPVEGSIPLTFLHGMIAATVLELVTGYTMEQLFKVRYWDYSNNFANYHGYICLKSSLCWGVMSILLTDVVHHRIEHYVLKVSETLAIVIALLLLLIFLIDLYHSVKAALDLRTVIERMTVIREQIEVQEEQFKSRLESKLDELYVRSENIREQVKERSNQQREKLQELKDEYHTLREHSSYYQRSLLKNYPKSYSKHFNEALQEIKSYLKKPD